MSNKSVANWQERAKKLAETSFDYDNALQLAQEIREIDNNSSVSYRAAQAVYIIQNAKRASKPSARQFSDAKMAIISLKKTLEQRYQQ